MMFRPPELTARGSKEDPLSVTSITYSAPETDAADASQERLTPFQMRFVSFALRFIWDPFQVRPISAPRRFWHGGTTHQGQPGVALLVNSPNT